MHEGLTKYPFRITVYMTQTGASTGMPLVKHFNAETVGQARSIQTKWMAARFVNKVEIAMVIDTWKDEPRPFDSRPMMEYGPRTTKAKDNPQRK
jgi:hypothetical protein